MSDPEQVLVYRRWLCSGCSRWLKTHVVWRNGVPEDVPDECDCLVARCSRMLQLLEENVRQQLAAEGEHPRAVEMRLMAENVRRAAEKKDPNG